MLFPATYGNGIPFVADTSLMCGWESGDDPWTVYIYIGVERFTVDCSDPESETRYQIANLLDFTWMEDGYIYEDNDIDNDNTILDF